jgi:hypothetical protein
MKKIIALLLTFLFVFTICGCNSNKLTAKTLNGRWETEITALAYSLISDDDLSAQFKDSDIPKSLAEKINNLKFKAVFEFDKQKANIKIPEAAIEGFYKDTINIVLDYYKNGGIIDLYKKQGIEINTNEELEELLKEAGTSLEGLLATMKAEMEAELKKEDNAITEKPINGYYLLYVKKPNYKISENVVTFYDKDDEYETFYFETVDKNTLKINKIYYNYEELNVSMTLNRIK